MSKVKIESSCKSMQTRRILAISLHLESVLANITMEEWHGMRDFTYNLDVNLYFLIIDKYAWIYYNTL